MSVSFKFNIIDPNNTYGAYKTKLQTILNAAGGEWASHLNVPERDVVLEYDVAFSTQTPPVGVGTTAYQIQLASGAAKSVVKIGTDDDRVIGTDTITGSGDDVYQVGTVTEMKTGTDPNGLKADAGITIYAPNLRFFYFDPHLNRRNDPIPAGMVDGYSAILHEMAHTLGFTSARNALGELPDNFMYAFDQHITVTQPGFYSFGRGLQAYNFNTGNFEIDPASDNAYKIYSAAVPFTAGNPNELGQGRFIPFDFNPDLQYQYYLQYLQYQDDLSTDLMGGIVQQGDRKTITKLDLAILKDAGVPVSLNLDATPEGILEIDGSGNPDHIDVSLTNGTLLIRVNDAVQTYNQTQSQGITAIVINGLAGDDYIVIQPGSPAVAINGGAGNDTIIGGAKGDSINGGGGNDLIYAGSGGDVVHGGDGKDIVYGQGGTDRLWGDASNDFLDGGDQTDKLYGGGGNDSIVGNIGDDFLYGEAGNDVVSGAGGKDRMDGGSGADAFYGGKGNDMVDYSMRFDAAITASIDNNANDGSANEGDNIFADVENIYGSPLDDRMVGSDGPNSLIGNSGNDTIDGIGGHDTLEGNAGNDLLDGSGGNDSLVGGTGNDRLYGGAGLDMMFGEDGDDSFFSDDNAAVDTLDGGNAVNGDSATADTVDILTSIEDSTLVGPTLPGG